MVDAPAAPAAEETTDWLVEPLRPVWDKVAEGFGAIRDLIVSGLSNLVSGAYDTIMAPVNDLLRSVVDWVQGKVQTAFGNDSEFGNSLITELQKIEDGIGAPAVDRDTAPVVAPTVGVPGSGPS